MLLGSGRLPNDSVECSAADEFSWRRLQVDVGELIHHLDIGETVIVTGVLMVLFDACIVKR